MGYPFMSSLPPTSTKWQKVTHNFCSCKSLTGRTSSIIKTENSSSSCETLPLAFFLSKHVKSSCCTSTVYTKHCTILFRNISTHFMCFVIRDGNLSNNNRLSKNELYI